MSVIYVLIPIAILLTIIGIYLFFWAVKTEQFDDLEKQGMSILFDDDNDKAAKDNNKSSTATNCVPNVNKVQKDKIVISNQVKK